jgi:hypothetical protein
VLGHTNPGQIRVEGGKLVAAGIISGHGKHVDEVVNAGTNGFPWQASIGARPIKSQFVPEGQSIVVNGRSVDGPVTAVHRSSLFEISFVSLGADDNTSARIAAQAAKGSTMEFPTWLAANGFAAESELSDPQKKTLQAAYDAEQKAGDDVGKSTATATPEKEVKAAADTTVVDDLHALRASRAAESRRIAKIEELTAKHPTIQAKAIEEGWTAEKAELEVLRAARPTATPQMFNINAGAGGELTGDIVAAACALSGGLQEKYAYAGLNDKQKEIAASKALRQQSIFGLCSIVAAAHNLHLPGSRMSDDVIKAMFRIDTHAAHNIEASTVGFSTISLSSIFQNVLNKAMLQAYGTYDSAIPEIAYETDTNDFKPYVRYRLTAAGTIAPIGPTGELKSIGLQDQSYSNQLTTTGAVLAIPRELFINDDMSALTDLPKFLVRQCLIAREKAVFNAILGNAGTFFGSGNTNYISGAATNLQISSLASVEQKFNEMKDANGDFIQNIPDRLLIPPALKVTALNLFNGASLVVGALGSTSGKTVEPNLNAFAGKYRPIVSPYLGAASPLSGGSDTAFYLLTNPASGMAPVQVGYLRGQRTPVVEQGEVDFKQLGMAMRIYWDFGVALFDPKSAVMSKGAA